MAVIFFPYYGFVSQDFPDKVFNDRNIYKDGVFFSFTMLLSHWVFLPRFLMRHHKWWASKGECYNWDGCPPTKHGKSYYAM